MSKNIILIGEPDSGKTTICEILSKQLGLKFLNVNQDAEDKSGHTINDGPLSMLEGELVNKFSELKSSVISTGVEVLKNLSNIKKIKENGIVIFIDKSIENEPNTCCERYDEYRKFCDLHLVNNDSIDEIVYYINSIYS